MSAWCGRRRAGYLSSSEWPGLLYVNGEMVHGVSDWFQQDKLLNRIAAQWPHSHTQLLWPFRHVR